MKIRLIAFLIIFLILLPVSLSAQQNISWSLALIKDNQSIPFSKPVEMNDGDTFSVAIIANQACYVYVIIQDSEDQIFVLLNQRFIAGQRYETNIFSVVPPAGSENFYIVVSHNEQKNLDNAIKAHANQSTVRTRRDLLGAVMAIRRSASAFNENPEKPVLMGGAFRGSSEGLGISGTEYGGAPVYVKNIVITH